MISHTGLALASSLCIRDPNALLSTSVSCLSDHNSPKEHIHKTNNNYYYYCCSLDNKTSDNLAEVPAVTQVDNSNHSAICTCGDIDQALPQHNSLTFTFDLDLVTCKTAAEWGRRWSAWIPTRCSVHHEKAECKDVISYRLHLYLPSCGRRRF